MILCVGISCSKGGSSSPTTPTPPPPPPPPVVTVPDSTCQLITIQQMNGTAIYNRLSFQRNSSTQTISMQYYDSVTNTIDYNYNFVYKGDSIIVDATSWMVKDPVTGNIIKYKTTDSVTKTQVDNVLYTYKYDASGRLSQKLAFYNQSNIADYISNYSYSGNNLTNCQLLMGDGKRMIMQTNITYDTVTIKPWLYLYGDAFENNDLLQAFPFGVRPSNTVLKMDTQIYDPNTSAKINQWITNFDAYVISSNKKVLQVRASGDLQQGLGTIIGLMNFTYTCKAN